MNKSFRSSSHMIMVGLALLPSFANATSSQTAAWLALQRSGEQASVNAQSLTDLERDKAVARFLKTYDYAIPASYYGIKFTAGK